MNIQPERSFPLNGDLIERRRRELKLSREALAAKCEVTTKTIRRWIKGAKAFLVHVELLAEALQVAPQQLVCSYGFVSYELGEPQRSFAAYEEVIRFLRSTFQSAMAPLLPQETVLTLREAASTTLTYKEKVKKEKTRDKRQEFEISLLWLRVANRIQELIWASHRDNDHPEYLELNYGVVYKIIEKARYWIRVDYWTDQDIEAAGMRLTPLVADIETLLSRHHK
jgi:transcriptional regulator with XRE-family HTH domain